MQHIIIKILPPGTMVQTQRAIYSAYFFLPTPKRHQFWFKFPGYIRGVCLPLSKSYLEILFPQLPLRPYILIEEHGKVDQISWSSNVYLYVYVIVTQRVWNAALGCSLKNDRMISVRFQGKPFNIMAIQVYAPTTNAEEAEVEWFYKDLQDLLELTPPKNVLFITGDLNAKVGSQEIPGVTVKSGLEVQNEAGQRLTK